MYLTFYHQHNEMDILLGIILIIFILNLIITIKINYNLVTTNNMFSVYIYTFLPSKVIWLPQCCNGILFGRL